MRIFPGMRIVKILLGHTRSTMRKAAVLLAATQIMLGSAPFLESGSRSASAHVEAAGVQLHYAHSDELCIACAATKIFASAQPSDPVSLDLSAKSAISLAASDTFDQRLAKGPHRSRAPPSPLLG